MPEAVKTARANNVLFFHQVSERLSRAHQGTTTLQLTLVAHQQVYNFSRISCTVFLHGTQRNSTVFERQVCSRKSCQAFLCAVAFAMYNCTLEQCTPFLLHKPQTTRSCTANNANAPCPFLPPSHPCQAIPANCQCSKSLPASSGKCAAGLRDAHTGAALKHKACAWLKVMRERFMNNC